MPAQHLSIRYPEDRFDGLCCPICGKEVAKSESPCSHVSFVLLAMEPGDFSFVADHFSDRAVELLGSVDEEEGLKLIDVILELDDDFLDFLISVASDEFEYGENSDLGYFGFTVRNFPA